MRRGALIVLLALAAVAPAAPAKPTQQQTFLRDALLRDQRTTSAVRTALREGRARVDARSGFFDLTGDEKTDAIALVTTGGAAGTIALYVLSTDGAKDLRAVLRLQQLHRATVRLAERRITVIEPVWSEGDPLSEPSGRRERDYTWNRERRSFRRTAVRTEPGAG